MANVAFKWCQHTQCSLSQWGEGEWRVLLMCHINGTLHVWCNFCILIKLIHYSTKCSCMVHHNFTRALCLFCVWVHYLKWQGPSVYNRSIKVKAILESFLCHLLFVFKKEKNVWKKSDSIFRPYPPALHKVDVKVKQKSVRAFISLFCIWMHYVVPEELIKWSK